MAALARQTDAKAIGGDIRHSKQNPHRKLRTIRKSLTEHIYEAQFTWTEDQRSLLGTVLTDLARGQSNYTGLQPVQTKISTPKPEAKPKPQPKVTKPVVKPTVPKPAAKVPEKSAKPIASRPIAAVEKPKPVVKQHREIVIDNTLVDGFIGLIQSGNVKQAKSYITYSCPTDHEGDTTSIRQAEQDWIRPHLARLQEICESIETSTPEPLVVEKEYDNTPVFVDLSQTITHVTVRGKTRTTSKQKIKAEVQRTKSYDAWLELHTPIVNRAGEPLSCDLLAFDTPTKVMTVRSPVPVMIGDVQVGVEYRSEVVDVPCSVSDSVATKYKWATIDSQLSKWGSSYVPPGDKLYEQVAKTLVHRWDKAPTQPAFGKGSTTDLPSTETDRFVSSETTFFHEIERIRSERFRVYQRLVHGHDTVHIELANSPRKLAESNLQDDVSLYNSVDTSGVPWDDTVEVVNTDSGATLAVNTEDEAYVIAGLADYFSKMDIWDRVEAKLKIQDRKEFLYKYAIAQDMERARESADEIARLDAWLHSREAETAVRSDYVRYNEWSEEQARLDPYGALQVHLMDMERRRPSFTLDSGEHCYTCKRSHFKHFLLGLKATSEAQFIGPKISGEAVVTPPVVPGKAGGVSDPPISMTNPIPGCSARLNLPDKESEESIFRKLILEKDEVPEKFLRLTDELKKDVVNFSIVRELTKQFVKSDTGILVPC